MAVSFRINYSGENRLHIELSSFIFRTTIYIEKNNDSVLLTIGSKKINLSNTTSNTNNFILPIPTYTLITIIKNSIDIGATRNYEVFTNTNLASFLMIVIIFNLFKNTDIWFLKDFAQKLIKIETMSKLFITLKFSIKLHIVGIFSYLFKILSARRKYHGSNI